MKITRAVLDTSVVIKWFRTFEPARDKVLYLREKFLDEKLTLAISDLLLYELTNVLRYKPDLSSPTVISILQSVLEMKMEIKSKEFCHSLLYYLFCLSLRYNRL